MDKSLAGDLGEIAPFMTSPSDADNHGMWKRFRSPYIGLLASALGFLLGGVTYRRS